jgi:hypothetical protein
LNREERREQTSSSRVEVPSGSICRASDQFLTEIPATPSEVNWVALLPVALRVVLRLIMSKDARESHLIRLKKDYLAYHETALADAEDLLSAGPFSDEISTVALLYILRDFDAIEFVASSAAQCSLGVWRDQFEQPCPLFRQGDRDDTAAQHLYEISKLLPSTDD